jgi:hypothetical protein
VTRKEAWVKFASAALSSVPEGFYPIYAVAVAAERADLMLKQLDDRSLFLEEKEET